MKIRTDFVTNSSSSSFILGFKNVDEIDGKIDELSHLDSWKYVSKEDTEDLKKRCKNTSDSMDTFGLIYNDNVFTEYEKLAKLKASNMYGLDIIAKTDKEKTEEKILMELMDEFNKKINGLDHFAYVEYRSNESELEKALRDSPITLEWFPHW